MSFQDLTIAARQYFPNFQVNFKSQNYLMKFCGKLLFFDSDFMTSYTTIIGNTIYFPNTNFISHQPISSSIILMHELVHLYDEKRIGKILFRFLYLFPQSLSLVFILLMFLLSWKLFLPLLIFSLLPLPAYFRMNFEKRAYLTSLYVIQSLANRLKFSALLKTQETFYLKQLGGSSYYFMWPFSNLQAEFDQAVIDIKAGKRPFEDPVFDILDDLVTKV